MGGALSTHVSNEKCIGRRRLGISMALVILKEPVVQMAAVLFAKDISGTEVEKAYRNVATDFTC
jgi:hypothetical protein